jgi:hypothetical protein
LKNPQGSLCGFFFGLTAKSAKDYCVKTSANIAKPLRFLRLKINFKNNDKFISLGDTNKF